MRVRRARKRGQAGSPCHQHLFPTVDSGHQVGPLGQGHEDQVSGGDLSLLLANQGNVGVLFLRIGHWGGAAIGSLSCTEDKG